MAFATENSEFVTPGKCKFEVTLVLDDKSRLYVCKDFLVKNCEFFKGLFFSDFKEKGCFEVKIQEVPHSEMLLFLDCQFGNKALPLDSDSLCSLISLADQFMCPSILERIKKHLGTEEMFLDLPIDTKLALIQVANKHKSNLSLLETCIRLCANLNTMDLAPLDGQVSEGVVAAVHSMVTQATKHIDWLSTRKELHVCSKGKLMLIGGRMRWVGLADTEYDGSSMMEVNDRQMEAWMCSACKGKRVKETLTYEKVKLFEIDQDMLRG